MARIQFLCKQYGKIFNKPYYAILLSVGFAVAAVAAATAACYYLLPKDDTNIHTDTHTHAELSLCLLGILLWPLFPISWLINFFSGCVHVSLELACVCVCISFYHSFYVCVYLNTTLYLFRKLFDIH